MSDKIYCGSAKVVPTQYGELTKVSFHKDDINKMLQYMKDNNGDWINLVIKAKKEPQEGKATHYLEVDTWKPKQGQEQPQAQEVRTQESNQSGDSLPF